MKASAWLGILLAISVTANAVFLYGIVDSGVSMTYLADEQEKQKQQLTVLKTLLMEYVKREPKASLVQRAEQLRLNVSDMPGENYFWIDDIRFETTDSRITGIKLPTE